MADLDWVTLIDSLDNPPQTPEQRAGAIAEVLRKGNPSALFCQMLAEMIQPQGKNCAPYVLKLLRKDRGRPKGPNWQVAFEMERNVVQHEVAGIKNPVQAAVADIQNKFGMNGNSRRKCETSLAAVRQWIRLERLWDEHIAKAPEQLRKK